MRIFKAIAESRTIIFTCTPEEARTFRISVDYAARTLRGDKKETVRRKRLAKQMGKQLDR